MSDNETRTDTAVNKKGLIEEHAGAWKIVRIVGVIVGGIIFIAYSIFLLAVGVAVGRVAGWL